MQHGRIPWPTPDELTDEQRAVQHAITSGPRASGAPAFSLTDDEGRLHGPFNAMLLAPQVGLAMQELGGALRYRTSLTDREREIAILQVAVARRSEFEWYAHERVGVRAGLTDDELADLLRGELPATFSAGRDAGAPNRPGPARPPRPRRHRVRRRRGPRLREAGRDRDARRLLRQPRAPAGRLPGTPAARRRAQVLRLTPAPGGGPRHQRVTAAPGVLEGDQLSAAPTARATST